MGLKNNIIDLALATKGDAYYTEGDKLVPEKYVIKRHPGQYWAGSTTSAPFALTKAHRILVDEKRLAAWSVTSAGIKWNANQIGLQLMNPKTETLGTNLLNIPSTRIFNPVKLFMNLTNPITMTKHSRFGLNLFNDTTYGDIQKELTKSYTNNRLYKLAIELGHISDPNSQPAPISKINKKITNISDTIGKFLGNDGIKINTLSGIGGPNSLFGIGTTNHFKSIGGATPNYISKGDKYIQPQKYNSDVTYGEFGTNIQPAIYNNQGELVQKAQTNSQILDILDSGQYIPGQGVPQAYNTGGTVTSGVTLAQILNNPTQKGLMRNNHPLINQYEDILRIQKQQTNLKTFEKKLDFTDPYYKQTLINNPGLEDVFVYKNKVKELENTSYNEVFQIEKRLGMGNSNELGTPLTEYEVDKLLSSHYNQSPNPSGFDKNNKYQYYHKVSIPLTGNGGIKLHSKIFNFDGALYKGKYVTHKSTEDLVKFRFNYNRPDGTAGFLQLRGYLTGMSDSHSPEWEPTRYIGRPDSVQKYDGYNRKFSFSFMVVAMSKNEKDVMWAKLSNLVDKISPIVSEQGYMSSPFVYLTIGAYILDEPGYLDGLTYTIDDDYPWDIADERPMYINVSTSFIFLGKESPSSKKDYFPMRSF